MTNNRLKNPLDHPELRALAQDMQDHGHDREAPPRSVMAMLGDRWTTLILMVLMAGPQRHADLKRIVTGLSHEGTISQRVLTLKLRMLERDGFVQRAVSDDTPVHVSYDLSEIGLQLAQRARAMVGWINCHAPQILSARKEFDAASNGP